VPEVIAVPLAAFLTTAVAAPPVPATSTRPVMPVTR
jgi:hypothetical protein